MIRLCRNIFSLFIHSREGSVLPLVALGMFVMIGATGVAVDMGRQEIVQMRMQNALDSAGLAAGTAGSGANLNTVVSNYFYANFPANYLGVTVNSLTVTPNATGSVLNLAVNGTLNTTFMNIFGISTMNVGTTSQITKQSEGMELVLVLDNTGSMMAPVDAGDSATDKITALKSAATQLLGILYGGNNTVQNLWVGVVPFTQAVNIGTGYPAWMDAAYAAPLDFGPVLPVGNSVCPSYSGTAPATAGTYNGDPGCNYAISSTVTHNPPATNFGPANWSGCVMTRAAPLDTSDDPPSASLFDAYWFAPVPPAGENNYDPWETSSTSRRTSGRTTTYTTTTSYDYAFQNNDYGYYGPNMFCPQPVQPMVAEENTIQNAINSMVAGGDTDLDIGMVWGWRMLSPRWEGLWGGEMNAGGLPLQYNTPNMQKVVVFMTDGMDRFVPGDYSGYGFLANDELGSTVELTAEETLDDRFISVCNAMKAEGIIIYTIGFGQANYDNPATEADRANDLLVDVPLLQECATDANHFFLAPTNAQLASAFEQIGNTLSNLYISH